MKVIVEMYQGMISDIYVVDYDEAKDKVYVIDDATDFRDLDNLPQSREQCEHTPVEQSAEDFDKKLDTHVAWAVDFVATERAEKNARQ